MVHVLKNADGVVTGVAQYAWVEIPPGYSQEEMEDAELFTPLSEIKAAATRAVMEAAEAARTRIAPYLKYIDTEYQVLAAQADAFVMAGRPEFPVGLEMLVQSAADSGKSVSDEADSIRTKRDQYIVLLNVTRSLRRQGASAIEAAGDAESINSVRDLYVGQLASL